MLKFYDTPDYNYLIGLMKNAMKMEDQVNDNIFDWNTLGALSEKEREIRKLKAAKESLDKKFAYLKSNEKPKADKDKEVK